MIVGLIACGNAKRSTPCQAADLYTGPVFRAYRRWIERNTEQWAILSAKHGVLSPTEVVAPYDMQLKDLPPNDRQRWAARVRMRILEMFPGGVYVVLAGAEYRNALSGLPYTYPMDGLPDMRFGKQMAWLKAHPVVEVTEA